MGREVNFRLTPQYFRKLQYCWGGAIQTARSNPAKTRHPYSNIYAPQRRTISSRLEASFYSLNAGILWTCEVLKLRQHCTPNDSQRAQEVQERRNCRHELNFLTHTAQKLCCEW